MLICGITDQEFIAFMPSRQLQVSNTNISGCISGHFQGWQWVERENCSRDWAFNRGCASWWYRKLFSKAKDKSQGSYISGEKEKSSEHSVEYAFLM
jgi:hypothetical protein